MHLFKRDESKDQVAAFLQDDEPGRLLGVVNYDSVLEYLTGLSDEDYDTINKVAVIYRKANTEAAKALGKEYKPSTYISAQEAEKLHDDETIAALIDEPELSKTQKTPSKVKGTKITVKD